MLALASLIAASCTPVSLTGVAVLGFEASYFVPSAGPLKGKRLWVADANRLSKYMDLGSTSIWRRKTLRIQACLAKGHFGHLAAYRHQLTRLRIEP